MHKKFSHFLLTCSCVVMWFGTNSGLRAEDWPTARHDTDRSGRSNESLEASKLIQSWVVRKQLPQPAWPGPAKWDAYAGIRGLQAMRDYDASFDLAVVGESLFFGSSADDAVHCLSTSDGRALWSFTTDAPIRVAPTIDQNRVYFGSDDGHAYCIDARTGVQVWKSEIPHKEELIINNGRLISRWPCRTGVLVDGPTAWFGLSLLPWRESYLCAVSSETGKPDGPNHYTRRLSDQTLEGGLLARDDMLVALRGRVAPFVFDRRTGKAEGSLKEGGGGSFATLTGDGILHGPGNKTGWTSLSDLNARKRTAVFQGVTAAVATDDSYVMIASKSISALDRKTGKARWAISWDRPLEVIVAGAHIFVGGDALVSALELQSGKRIWSRPVQGRALCLAVADGALFASTDEGAIHCFRPTKESIASDVVPTTRSSRSRPVARKDASTSRKPGEVGHWLFHAAMGERAERRGVAAPERHVADLAGTNGGVILGDVQLREVGGAEALELDGKNNSVLLHEDHKLANLPVKAITAEAWVRVTQPTRWGGIVGAVQDNGADEKGWILGYSGSKFSFAIAGREGPGRLHYLTGTSEFDPDRWYHVLGTYDGTTQQIFVNGILENSARVQRGSIVYPPKTFYEIGAYHDQNENYRMTGLIHEIRIYDRALASSEIVAAYDAKKDLFPIPVKLRTGPYAQFTDPETAVIRWQTANPSPSILEWRGHGPERRIVDPKPKTRHEVRLTNLRHNRVGGYTIGTKSKDRTETTPEFDLDTAFNYSVQRTVDSSPFSTGEARKELADWVRRALNQTGIHRGICLVVGIKSGELAWEIVRHSGMRVICLDIDRKRVEAARRAYSNAGVYGTRIAVHHVESFDQLPPMSRFANLIMCERVLEDSELRVDGGEMFRALRPDGGTLYVGSPSSGQNRLDRKTLKRWFESFSLEYEIEEGDHGISARVVRGPLEGAGEWSHLYGRSDNSAYGGEELAGAQSAGELAVQWMGRPGPRAQPDRNGRKPSPLSVKGRLFVQGLHRLIGMDAYNGSPLWSLEIPSLERFNMPRDCSNWCADSKSVFVAIGDQCWQIDAEDGTVSTLHAVVNGDKADWSYDWSYVARTGDVLLGSAVKHGSGYTNFWGNADAGWYDARSGPVTFKICSENLFAMNPSTGQPVWTYSKGLIINSTITASQDRIYFVESRHPAVKESSSRRVGMKELWQDQFLVSLDVATGATIWEAPIDTEDGNVMFSMALGDERLVVAASNNSKYEVTAFTNSSGTKVWEQSFGWLGGKGDHGKAMSRPVIVNDSVYVRPKVLELSTGRIRELTMPGGGCGTYVATTNALFFRSGNVTAWSSLTGSQTSWNRLRPGCWLSTIPAGGMLLSPEAGGGCSCGSWMETSLGLMPVR